MSSRQTKAELLKALDAAQKRILELERAMGGHPTDVVAEAIRNSEERFRRALKNSPVTVFIQDLELRYIWIHNPHPDFDEQTVLGKTDAELLIPEDAQKITRIKSQVLATGVPAREEVQTTINGRAFFYDLAVEPLHDENAAIIGVTCTSVDITDRKNAEDALKLRERILRLFVEHSPAAIAMFDRDMRYIVASRRYLQDYRLGDQDLTGRSHYEVFPEIPEHWKQIHQRCLNGMIEGAEADPFPRTNGDLDWVSWEIRPWYEAAGRVGGIILFSEVITERKVSQERLRESEERYRLFFSQSFEGISRTEFDHPIDISLPVEDQIDKIYENAYIAEANQAMAEMYNTQLDWFIGTRLLDAHGGKNNPVNRDAFRKFIAGGYRSTNDETVEYTTDGKPVWFLNNTIGIVENGKLVRMWGTAINITDRKLAEQSLIESEDKYRTLINSTSDGVFVSRDERFIFFNAALPGMLGYTPQEFLDVSFEQVIVSEHLALFREKFQKGLEADEKISNCQVQLLDKTGISQVWVEMRLNRVNYGGRPAILGIAHDITDQKRALEQIENLAKFPAENPGPVLRIDLNGKLLYANEASFALLTEWTLSVGKQAQDILLHVVRQVIEIGRDKTIETIHHGRVIILDFILLQHGGYVNVYGRDITEQRRAEEKLRESERRFLTIFENTPIAIGISRLSDRKLTDVNSALLELLGFSREEMIGHTALELNFWWDIADREYMLEYLKNHQRIYGYETAMRRKSGEKCDVLLSAEIIDINNEPSLLIQLADITERKKMEQEIRLVNERFVELANHVVDVFWVAEPSTGKYIYVSPAFSAIFGLDMENTANLQNGFLDMVLPEDRHSVVQERKRGDRGNKTDMNYRICRPDGSVRWLREKGTPVFDGEGTVIRVVGITTDITEQVEADKRMKESEMRFQQIAETIPEMFWMFNNRHEHMEYVSPAYTTIWGRSVQELYEDGSAFLAAILDEDKAQLLEALDRQEQGEVTETEYRVVQPDGSIRWVHDRSFPIFDEAGFLARTAGIVTDITERKLAEVERQKLIHDLGERVKELTVLHQASRLFQNLSLSEADMLRNLVEILPNAWQYTEITAARIITEDKVYATANFSESPWMQNVSFNLPNDRRGWIEVVYLEERPAEDEGPFSDEERTLLETLAERLQSTIMRRSMERDLRKRTEDLASLVEAGRALNETLDAEQIYSLTYRYIQGSVPCEQLVLFSFDPQTRQVAYEYVRSNEGPQNLDSMPAFLLGAHGYEVQSRVISSGRSLLLHEIEATDIKMPGIDGPVRSAMLVPLKVNGVVVGLLQVLSAIANSHTSNHLQFLEALAFQVSAALSNARLFSELEERVRQRTAEVQDLYDNAPTGFHSLDAHGCFVNVNQTELNWLGYTKEEMLGHSFQEFITPETRHVFIDNFPVFKQRGWVNDLEFEMLRKDGSKFPVLLSATAMWDKDGTYLMSRSTVFDNSQRKKAELALRESEETYRALFESANDAIFMIKTDGTILRANPQGSHLLDIPVEELIGRKTNEFVAPAESAQLNEEVQSLLAGERLPIFERKMVKKNGELVDTEINMSLIRDQEGRPNFIQSVIRDISARKYAENALRESEEQNRLLFEESPEAVVLFEQNGRVVRMNHAFTIITGIPGSAFIGRSITEIGTLPGELTTILADSSTQKDPFTTIEFKLNHASGEVRDISTRIFRLNLNGQLHFLASMHDITARKRAEEALRLANAEMERALRLKDEFLANMSHELRTPLNAILGISESLLEQISGPLNEKQAKYLQTVLESAQHLLDLINDILDLAKINAGRIELEVNKVDISTVAYASLRMIRELAQKKNVNVTFEIDPKVKLTWADERRLKQMLVNLLSNAVKFTPEGGNIGLEISGDLLNSTLNLTVWDTGIGISQQDLRLLFQPFIQLDAGLARGSQGTGLGLVLVSQMARLHGGSVSVESKPGKGSRFTISIPWVAAGETSHSIQSAASVLGQDALQLHGGKRHTILLVEDTESVTMLIRDYLEQHGYNVFTAKDGFEGIARAGEIHPDLILMDVMMPEMDGFETTRRIRNETTLATVPIIALTALAMSGDRERCLAAGMNDYLSKPVKLKELLKIIELHLHTRREEPHD